MNHHLPIKKTKKVFLRLILMTNFKLMMEAFLEIARSQTLNLQAPSRISGKKNRDQSL